MSRSNVRAENRRNMWNKQELINWVTRTVRQKTLISPTINERNMTAFVAAYRYFMGMTGSYKNVKVQLGAAMVPKNCEWINFHPGLQYNEDGSIDGLLIMQGECLRVSEEDAIDQPLPCSPAALIIGTASQVGFSASGDNDTFIMQLVYPRICSVPKCKADRYIAINMAQSGNDDGEPEGGNTGDVLGAEVIIRYGENVEHPEETPIFKPFYDLLASDGISDVNSFCTVPLKGIIKRDAYGDIMSVSICASGETVCFDPHALSVCIAAARSFTVVGYDTGVVEVCMDYDAGERYDVSDACGFIHDAYITINRNEIERQYKDKKDTEE